MCLDPRINSKGTTHFRKFNGLHPNYNGNNSVIRSIEGSAGEAADKWACVTLDDISTQRSTHPLSVCCVLPTEYLNGFYYKNWTHECTNLSTVSFPEKKCLFKMSPVLHLEYECQKQFPFICFTILHVTSSILQRSTKSIKIISSSGFFHPLVMN